MTQSAERAHDLVGSTLRLTVLATAQRADLVVPEWLQVVDLAEVVQERLQLAEPPTLLDAAGRPLPPERSLTEAGLRHGAVVVVAPQPGAAAAPDEEAVGPGDAAPTRERVWAAGWLVDLATAAVVVGAVSAAVGTDPLRTVAAGLLVLLAVAALLPGGTPRLRTQRRHLVPWCLGGAALAAVGLPAEQPLLPIAVAGLGAFAAAGVLRAVTDDDVVSMVWLWGAGTVALVSTTLLVVGAGVAGLWSTLLVLALVWIRLLPTLVVDVPDDTLLDLERLAVTAWSSRDDRPRGRRRRRIVRRHEVAGLAREGGAMLRAGTAGGVLVMVVATALLLDVADGLSRSAVVGGRVQVGVAAVALALVARAYRDWRLQALLRAGAATMVLLLGAALGELGATTSLVLAAALAAVATGVVWAALALGRGWRSVWWARMADVGQSLCIATSVALLPLASGLFDLVWRFTS